MIKGKKIVLGISGSIAAYKSALLVRLLKKEGAEVKVILTEAAKDFITPLTLATLSKNPVLTKFIKTEEGIWNNHVELGLWADIFVIAPASAHTLAKCAHGICDNLLVATYLSARCEVLFCPAMDLDMYSHPSTISNLEKLRFYGNCILDAENGELASGLSGKGRMAEPETILALLKKKFSARDAFKNKKVLITAGPTQEAIDPVRYVSNHSTGKMAYAIADAFVLAGAEVNLISGPVALEAPEGINLFPVVSAREMYEKTMDIREHQDIFIFAAAVADYSPTEKALQKIKKNTEEFHLKMAKNKDIALEVGKLKKRNQLSIGFALETENALANAQKKVLKKNFDFLVLNSLQDKGAGFRYDTNQVTFIDNNGVLEAFELKAKTEVAIDILQQVEKMIQ